MRAQRLERLLLAGLLAPVLALAWLDASSEASARLRAGTPLAALLDLKAGSKGLSGGVYLASYIARERRLELVYLGPSATGTLPEGLPAASWRIDWEAPGDPSAPGEVGRWIRSWPRDIRFWLAVPGSLLRLRRRSAPPITLYDALRLCFEAYRLEPGSVGVSWLPEPADLPRLLPRLQGLEGPKAQDDPVTVEVLNASGASGVALQATKVLRLRGLDVVEFRNAPEPRERTFFWDRSGERESASRAAEALGCGGADILTRLETRRGVRVTAVLGRDYAGCRMLREGHGTR